MNMIRMIISLFIICLFMPLSTMALDYTSKIDFPYDEINDEIALYQLRQILLISYDIKVNYDRIDFIYQNKEFRLSLVNNKMILQPGTQIFLSNVDTMYFDEINSCIYILYEKNSKQFKKIIASQNGIYLDEFSDCFESDDEHHSAQE